MPNEVLYDDLDPGIREVVRWLNDNDFDTCDSGDGKAKFGEDGKPLPEWDTGPDAEYDCVNPFPHVAMRVPTDRLVHECDRLRDLLTARGVPLEVQGLGDSVSIQGTYDPALADREAHILLFGLDDVGLG
jgi:hypothetical protein